MEDVIALELGDDDDCVFPGVFDNENSLLSKWDMFVYISNYRPGVCNGRKLFVYWRQQRLLFSTHNTQYSISYPRSPLLVYRKYVYPMIQIFQEKKFEIRSGQILRIVDL